MTLSQEQFELIEAYLANELSAGDARAFEQEIAADPALQAEIQTQRTMRIGLQALAIEQRLQRTRQRMLEAETAANQPASQESSPIVKPLNSRLQPLTWVRWAAAASVVLGLGIGVYWSQQQLPELAYSDTASADQLTKGLPTDLRPADRQRITDAIRGYKAGQYDQVIEQLKIPAADRRTAYYQSYFLGLSYLANKQPERAIASFKTSLGTSSVPLRQKANWFLALAYLKNKENEKALPILEAIRTDRAHPYHDLAERLYAKVKD